METNVVKLETTDIPKSVQERRDTRISWRTSCRKSSGVESKTVPVAELFRRNYQENMDERDEHEYDEYDAFNGGRTVPYNNGASLMDMSMNMEHLEYVGHGHGQGRFREEATATATATATGQLALLDSPVEQWRKEEDDEFLTVLPLGPSSLLESYFALFALCMAINVPTSFLGVDFEGWPFNRHWFKGELVKSGFRLVHRDDGPLMVATETLAGNELLEIQPELIPRLQRLIAVVNDKKSVRRFVSCKLINKGVDIGVAKMLQESEHLYEVFPQFMKNLHSDMDMCLKGGKTSKLFLSKALHKSDLAEPFQPTSLTVLNFSPENYAASLYEMFNPMLLPEESDMGYELENAFDFLAPVFTIIFDGMDETSDDVNLSHGVEIPLEFYPQLYTKDSLQSLVVPILDETDKLRSLNKAKLNKMSSLQSFQGKQVSSFLNSTVDYVSSDPLASDQGSEAFIAQLESIKDQLTAKKRETMAEYTDLQKQISSLSLDKPDLVIEKGKKMGLIDEPYLLRLAALSPYDYMVGHSDGKWTRHRIDLRATKISVDNLTGLEVQDIIKAYTRHASETPILFVFIKRDHIDDENAIQEALQDNKTVRTFMEQDREVFNLKN